MKENTFKNGLVRVSCEFLTEVIIAASNSKVPPDTIATGVYYDPSSDAFVFIIASEMLGTRKELDPIPEVAQVTKDDLAKFFEGFTGRTWGRPMSTDDFVEQGREVLSDFERGHATERELKTVLKLIIEHFEEEGEES